MPGAGSARVASASRNRLPSGIALCDIRVIAFRIGTIVPGLRGRRLAVVVKDADKAFFQRPANLADSDKVQIIPSRRQPHPAAPLR